MGFDSLLTVDKYLSDHLNDVIDFDTRGTSFEGANVTENTIGCMHVLFLRRYSQIDFNTFTTIDRDQLNIYIAALESIPYGDKLVSTLFPAIQGVSGFYPSRPTMSSKFHSDTVKETIMYLNQDVNDGDDIYEIKNEFNGLSRGIFPIDSAVYFGKKLIAFIEIDGEFHYKVMGQQLRRKDLLKEFLYQQTYKNIPLFRIRADQCAVIGISRAAMALSKWIRNSCN